MRRKGSYGGSLATSGTYMWQDDAACAFLPPTMFEVARKGDPIAEDLSELEILDLNTDNLSAAQKACAKCPVMDKCYTEAHPDDFLWTMRAGVMPVKYSPRPVGRPRNGGNEAKSGSSHLGTQGTCRRGHVDQYVIPKSGGDRYCGECSRVRGDTSRAERGIEPLGKRGKCKRGHSDWKVRANGSRACAICRRDADRAWKKAKREAAKLGA